MDVVERICGHIEKGRFFETACRLEGINPKVFDNWLRENPDSEQKHRLELAKAKGEDEMMELLISLTEAGKSTSGAQFLLEKRFPKRWGRGKQLAVELSGPKGRPIEQKVELDASKIEGLVRIARKKPTP
jgi:hypothetical protein